MPSYDWGNAAKPFLKWAGSKRFLLPKILPRLPAQINTYYEPFVGGGAVLFALASEIRFKKAIIGDANADLIATYEELKLNVDEVVDQLEVHARKHSEDYYYKIRAQDPADLHTIDSAARIIYLNRTCFNGLYRVNKKGKFNVPFGRYKNPRICDEENLRAVHDVLLQCKVRPVSLDFEVTVKKAREGDAVYFDPPYAPLSATSDFTSFTKDGFGTEDQVRLRDCFKALDKQGVHVLLSNSDTPLVRELYKGFPLSKVRVPRRVNSKGDKRGDVGELLISGKKG